jgi:hypothetical protein
MHSKMQISKCKLKKAEKGLYKVLSRDLRLTIYFLNPRILESFSVGAVNGSQYDVESRLLG